MAIVLTPPKKPEGNIRILPLITLKEGVIFPDTEAILTFGRPASINGVNEATQNNSEVCFVSQKSSKISDPKPENLYSVGTICQVVKTLPVNDELHAIVKGISRVKIHSIEMQSGKLLAAVSLLPDVVESSQEVTALVNHVTGEIKEAVNLGKNNIEVPTFMKIISTASSVEISHQIASVLNIKNGDKQNLLEEINLKTRLNKISDLLAEEVKILQIEKKISDKTQKKFDKNMKEAVLRERMRTIQKELGELEEDSEVKELREKIKLAKLPDNVWEKTNKELDRLAKLSIHNPETGYIRSWIETIAELPWAKTTMSNLSLTHAEKILNQDHYGLEKVKERILEYIAVLKLKAGLKKTEEKSIPTILCFVGPPGVGKTSVGKSIAKSLGRKFVKMSLGGMRDEAEIRGHRRTYVGAMPGRIIQLIKDAGTNNPVFMLDEIDKVGNDFRGDPSSALLEVLDPEQNATFQDYYLDVPFDLSHVVFITTANVLDTIPPALRDRLEVIEFSGYTEDEKLNIGQKYLISKELINNALSSDDVAIPTGTLKAIIKYYTREAGVRNLDRLIATVMRKAAIKKAKDKHFKKAIFSDKQLTDILGPKRFTHSLAEKSDQVGVATGLAYTQVGGDILFIEVATMPGKGNITLTGQLGSVMKESAKAALSYVKSHAKQLELDYKKLSHSDIHIHVPEGAVPKDGPSAGLAITTAIISAFSGKPFRKELAMTGEVTLRGRALEIGGVKEKVIAAHRAGIKEVILPKDNEKSLIEVPKNVQKDLKFHFVENMDDVVKIVFAK
ncbi:endopeptidase La [Candidatus Collierbacteria bacterium RIFCSPLOWO2_01_FULL_50_23]|uniref:Lon protease n=1 Tax=Candidatus Collierbacteria bacterium RIFCSPHIGHO2_01_FULL_50_25 TaxID=1817722 RepID=A0A1F5EWX3_9BACT|nr:MAG: endopeptidase La [Candidatus Collierbacteria bacterium RIFCSPHIGHO2_01_FULL_50_25]OGD74802.1 MAG: endopeptidase La [Candidatus Collierbacteria bacterium RIFCSPLOWO2_01_FULL_50_23]